jgi:hypothetical protein
MNETDLNLHAKLEEAFRAVLESDATIYTANTENTTSRRLTVLTGLTASDQVLPVVFFACNGGPEDPLGSGNFMMEGELTVKTKLPKPDSISEHNKNVGAVRKSVLTSDLDSRLSAAVPDFTVFADCVWCGQSSESIEGDLAVWTQHFKIYCCAAVIS